MAGVNLTGTGLDSGNGVPEIPGAKKHRFPELRGMRPSAEFLSVCLAIICGIRIEGQLLRE